MGRFSRCSRSEFLAYWVDLADVADQSFLIGYWVDLADVVDQSFWHIG